MQNFLIVGCTSGIGKALSELLLQKGQNVLGAGRNTNVLRWFSEQYPQQFKGLELDLRKPETIASRLSKAAQSFGPIDVVVVLSSITGRNPQLEWDIEEEVILTNVLGWTAVCLWAAHYFEQRGAGHLVGVTSLAKYLSSVNPSYIASKAFEGKYLDGLRLRLEAKGIRVTEIMPGFVDTPMIADRKNKFWAIPADKAAQCLLKAIARKKRRAVISAKWKIFRYIAPHISAGLHLKLFRE